jgi:2'-5' RNA ligase
MRLFVAIYPPPEVASGLLDALARVPGVPGTPIPVGGIHLTLLFIGECDPRQLDAVTESVERSAAGIPRGKLTISAITGWPPGKTPRMAAAIAAASPEILEVQRRLAKRLARHPRAREEERFSPHITLQRYPHATQAPRVELSLEPVVAEVSEIRLMRSTLAPGGSRHDQLASFSLGG